MATTGDAPLSLTLPQSADLIDLAVLNSNYVAINALAATQATTLASGTVYNSTRWNGKQVFVQSTAPSAGVVAGDIWLKVQ
jgi:hypothetical protein